MTYVRRFFRSHRAVSLPSFRRYKDVALPSAGLGSLLVLWWAGTAWLGEPSLLRRAFSPDRCFAELAGMLSSGVLVPHIVASLKRVFVSLVLAVLAGVPVGILIGVSSNWDRATSMVFQFIRMISPLSWMPVAIMLFGIGDAPVYFLLTAAAVWPVILNTSAGVGSVEPRWILLAHSMSATKWETIRAVVAPAIFTHVLTGIRLAIGVIWIVLVPAEMLGVSDGLGYYILDTRDRLAYSELVAMILLVGAIGYLLDLSARRAHRAWTHESVDRDVWQGR